MDYRERIVGQALRMFDRGIADGVFADRFDAGFP